MDKDTIIERAAEFLRESDFNRVAASAAFRPELAGMRFFDEPLVGCAAAGDAYLASLADNEEAKMFLDPPSAWLGGAETAVSVFLPYTEQIRKSNRGGDWPSDEWLHGRIEGQSCTEALARFLRDQLAEDGHSALIPAADARFRLKSWTDASGERCFGSNWSERHVAYAAGLGTFSLSRGLITEKGVAGRFFSLITSLALEPTPRPYAGLTDYCTLCGKCAKNCPASAIRAETGKSHGPCSDFLDLTREKLHPYYGCGKCQTAVPCESRRP
jgi:epoxyqueuosine reductase QueG